MAEAQPGQVRRLEQRVVQPGAARAQSAGGDQQGAQESQQGGPGFLRGGELPQPREVARRGSFSAAARAMDMSPANASKYVAALEEHFGVRLFNRSMAALLVASVGYLLMA